MKAIGERGAGNPPATFDEGRQGSSYRLLYPVIKRWKRRKSTRTHIHASGFKRSLKDNRIRFNSNNERQKRLLLLFQELCCLVLARSSKNSKFRGLINLSVRRLVGYPGGEVSRSILLFADISRVPLNNLPAHPSVINFGVMDYKTNRIGPCR